MKSDVDVKFEDVKRANILLEKENNELHFKLIE